MLSPKLTVTKPNITETETDTLECRPVDVVTASQCYFYTLTKEETKVFSCLKTLTGTELLLMSGQTSPAEVQLRCFYTVNLNGINPSPHSNTVSVIVDGEFIWSHHHHTSLPVTFCAVISNFIIMKEIKSWTTWKPQGFRGHQVKKSEHSRGNSDVDMTAAVVFFPLTFLFVFSQLQLLSVVFLQL